MYSTVFWMFCAFPLLILTSCKTLSNNVDEKRLACRSQKDRLARLQYSDGSFIRPDDPKTVQAKTLNSKVIALTAGGCVEINENEPILVVDSVKREVAYIEAGSQSQDSQLEVWRQPSLRLNCGTDNLIYLNSRHELSMVSDERAFNRMLNINLEIYNVANGERKSIDPRKDIENRNAAFDLDLKDGEYLLSLNAKDPFGDQIKEIPACSV
ncbi:MAG: hypothetical protein EOP04_33375, partial [Proteobacteria bacterium]